MAQEINIDDLLEGVGDSQPQIDIDSLLEGFDDPTGTMGVGATGIEDQLPTPAPLRPPEPNIDDLLQGIDPTQPQPEPDMNIDELLAGIGEPKQNQLSPAVGPNQPVKQVKPIEGIVDALKQTPKFYQRGKQAWESARDITRALVMGGEEEANEALEASRQMAMEQEQLPVADNFAEKAITGVAEAATGFIKGGILPQAVGALGGAGAALAIGNLSPLAVAPEEVFTVPAGIKAGQMAGKIESARRWWSQGTGEFYQDMRESGIPHDIAKVSAMLGAIPYAGIELLQFKTLMPKSIMGKEAFRDTMKEAVKAGTAEIVKRGGMEYIKTVAAESGEEGLQEIVKDITGNIAQNFNGTPEQKKRAGEIINRAVKVTLESIPTMTLLGLGGNVTDTGVALNRRSKVTNIEQQKKRANKIFGEGSATQVDENTLDVSYGNGNGYRMIFVPDLVDDARTNPKEFMDSIKKESKQGLQAVKKAMKDAKGDVKKAVDLLANDWIPAGNTVSDTVVRDSEGNETDITNIIKLEQGWATDGQAEHEVWHVLKKVADITPEEDAELARVIGEDEETQAYAYQNYADRNPILRKVRNAVDFILGGHKKTGETDEEVATRVREEIVARTQEAGEPVVSAPEGLSDVEKQRVDFQFTPSEAEPTFTGTTREEFQAQQQQPQPLALGEGVPEAVQEEVAEPVVTPPEALPEQKTVDFVDEKIDNIREVQNVETKITGTPEEKSSKLVEISSNKADAKKRRRKHTSKLKVNPNLENWRDEVKGIKPTQKGEPYHDMINGLGLHKGNRAIPSNFLKKGSLLTWEDALMRAKAVSYTHLTLPTKRIV